MRSRTLRGVPEWSGGKDLYMGSPVSGIGTSFGVIGIVPGPPEGSRGPTGWGHPAPGATWAVGGAPWPTWAKGTSPTRPMRLGFPRGRSPTSVRHLLGALGGRESPLGRRTPWEIGSPRTGAPLGAYIKGGGRGQPHPKVLAPPSPCYTSSSSVTSLAKPCRSTAAPTTPRRRAAVGAIFLNLSFPLAGSRRRRRLPSRTCVERGGAVRSALGHR